MHAHLHTHSRLKAARGAGAGMEPLSEPHAHMFLTHITIYLAFISPQISNYSRLQVTWSARKVGWEKITERRVENKVHRKGRWGGEGIMLFGVFSETDDAAVCVDAEKTRRIRGKLFK